MKKRALIIGNDEGLPGVKKDIQNVKSFLMSPVGGCWNEPEIKTMMSPLKSELQNRLAILKGETLDYLIIYFSGHGGQLRETMLGINGKQETIADKELQGIAVRQMNIYDCCRCFPEGLTEGFEFRKKAYSLNESIVREGFERRIMKALPQQVLLYSCSIGEYSNDTRNGGIYTNYLLQCAGDLNAEFKLVGDAHSEASAKTIENNVNVPEGQEQHPDSLIIKCYSDRQLIIGIRS